MAIVLTNNSGNSMTFGGHRWTMYLTMAEYYGWKPSGTKKPKGYGLFRSWPGSYDTSDGQIVTRGDARNLGQTVAHALTDPNFDKNAAGMEKQMKEEVASRTEPELMESFQLSFAKEVFAEFGQFCDKGSFRIE